MPGEGLEDALRAARTLGADDIASTLTLLGENLTSSDAADGVLEHYLTVLRAAEANDVDVEISVKPTQMGLDFGAEEARERIAKLVEATDSTVWIDMESSGYLDATLDIFRRLRQRRPNVGLCLQAYLRRTEADLEALLPLDPAIRLVKGAYRESPDLAFPKKADVDRNFVKLTGRLMRVRVNGGAGRPVIATHDDRMIGEANRLAFELGLDKSRYEFGMLYGISTGEQARLARSDYQVRVLISYGSAWFPWYMRRLAERPANLWFVLKQLLRG
jgi:proline dehydrogenase